MKKIVMLVVGLALVATVASAQTGSGSTNAGGKQNKAKTGQNASKGTSKSVTAKVVSVDAAAKTIALEIDGQPSTVALTGKAVTEAANFKAGDVVTVMLHDKTTGEHTSISSIKTAKKKKK